MPPALLQDAPGAAGSPRVTTPTQPGCSCSLNDSNCQMETPSGACDTTFPCAVRTSPQVLQLTKQRVLYDDVQTWWHVRDEAETAHACTLIMQCSRAGPPRVTLCSESC